ncbi:MAG: NAD(P)-binding domain-containing protein [Desulfobacterales bacterium]|nr:NAD(P)-binding domain-containing protein [Desulfobacterales bacterium]
MMKPKVGFLGMGIMGQPMALNIRKAGYELMVYNRTVNRNAAATRAGAALAESPKQVAQWADVIFFILRPACSEAQIFRRSFRSST